MTPLEVLGLDPKWDLCHNFSIDSMLVEFRSLDLAMCGLEMMLFSGPPRAT